MELVLRNVLRKIYYWLRIMDKSNYDHGNELENNSVSFPGIFAHVLVWVFFLMFWFRIIYLTWQSYRR